jgi:hypothetical protein
MGKSLTETAKSILMNEGAIPSVSASGSNPDRDATSTTVNKSSLRPGAKSPESRFSTPGSTAPSTDAEDLGGATPTSTAKENLGARASGKVGKDTSKSANSAVAAEKSKKQSEMMEEDIDLDEEDQLHELNMRTIERASDKAEAAGRKLIGKAPKKAERKFAQAEKFYNASGNNRYGPKGSGAMITKTMRKKDPFDDMENYSPKKIRKEDLDEEIQISEELEAFIAEMVEEGYSEEQIAEAIDENFELVSEEAKDSDDQEENEDDEEEEKMDEEYEVDMSEHVEALFAGEELSEEFKTKALTIFEAAVRQKVEEEIALLEAAYAETLEEQVAQIQEDLSSNVDDYLNYVVEQWVGENEVAIEAGLRSELTEDFISGLRNLFSEHYIDIPEDRVNVVEEMGSTVADLEQKLNEEIERNVQLTRFLNESKQNEILSDAAYGLTDTQAEKLKSLSEGIDFTSVNEYAQKINILKESYFSSSVNSDNALDRTESYGDGKSMISEELNGPMAAYVKTLGRTVK